MNSDELIILLAKRYENEYNKPKILHERIERDGKKEKVERVPYFNTSSVMVFIL